MGTVVADEISSSMAKARSGCFPASRESGKFWDMYEWTDESFNTFYDFLKEILHGAKESFVYDWEELIKHFLTSERYSELNGEGRLGLSFDEFKHEVENEWDSFFRFWWLP